MPSADLSRTDGQPGGCRRVLDGRCSDRPQPPFHPRGTHVHVGRASQGHISSRHTPAPAAVDERGRSSQTFLVDVVVKAGGAQRRATANRPGHIRHQRAACRGIRPPPPGGTGQNGRRRLRRRSVRRSRLPPSAVHTYLVRPVQIALQRLGDKPHDGRRGPHRVGNWIPVGPIGFSVEIGVDQLAAVTARSGDVSPWGAAARFGRSSIASALRR